MEGGGKDEGWREDARSCLPLGYGIYVLLEGGGQELPAIEGKDIGGQDKRGCQELPIMGSKG
jgi:hypothetical protein